MTRPEPTLTPQQIVESGLPQLGSAGGFVVVEHTAVVNQRWANSTLTTNGHAATSQVSVVAFESRGAGGASGSASGQVREPADLTQLVAAARAVAAAADPAEDYVTPVSDAETSAGWDDPADGVSPADLAPVAALLADVLPAGTAAGVEHFGYAEQAALTTYLGTSAGLRARLATRDARFELCGKSHGRTRSAWAGRGGAGFADLDLSATPAEVARGLAAQANRVPVGPGRHTAILSPSAASDLLVYLLWSAAARDALEGRNAFRGPGGTTAIGNTYSRLPISLRTDPHAPGLTSPDRLVALGSSAVSSAFDTGLPIPAVDFIADGKLAALVTTRSSAARGNLPMTPAADNLIVEVAGHHGTLDEVAARAGNGLLLTCLWYIREVDPQNLLLTGLTRDGVYVVRDGEVVGAAGNFRFNESPIEMLSRLRDAGSPARCLPREWADWFTRAQIAPLVIDGFNFSTASDAV